jgi:hypothetical protein
MLSTVLFLMEQTSVFWTHQSKEAEEKSTALKPSDVACFALPAIAYTFNNLAVLTAMGANDPSVFGVVRDTTILWTAGLWRMVFWTPLGNNRITAIVILVSGLMLNQCGTITSRTLSWGVAWVLVMTFCNSAGSVLTEFAFKRNSGLDINLQNMILYLFCILSCMSLIFFKEPELLQSDTALFFRGFTQITWTCIGLQACAGLLVSRLLKHTDAMMKSCAVCLRGPILAVIAPLSMDVPYPGFTRLISAFIVAAGSFYYLTQGPVIAMEHKGKSAKL